MYLWGDMEQGSDRIDSSGAVQMGQPQQYPNYLTAIRQVKKEPLYNYMSAIDMFNANNVIMTTYLNEEYEFKDSRTGPFKKRMTDDPPRDHSQFLRIAQGAKTVERKTMNVFTKPIHTKKKLVGSLLHEDDLSDEEDGTGKSEFVPADPWAKGDENGVSDWIHASNIDTETMYDLPLEKAGLFVDGDLNINPPGEVHQPKIYTGLLPVMKINPIDPWNNRSSTMDNEVVEDMLAHFIVTYKILFKFDPVYHDAHNLCQYLAPHLKLGPSTNVYLTTRYNIKGFLDKEYNMKVGRENVVKFNNKLYFMRGRQHDFVYGSHMLMSRPSLSTRETRSASTPSASTATSNSLSTERGRNRHPRPDGANDGTMGAPTSVYDSIVGNAERDIEANRIVRNE